MTKLLWNALKVSPAIAALFFANTALAGELNQKTTVAQLSQEANSIGQVTSVSQFSDVRPTDWAYRALQSLVERYGCISGFPDNTFRGNRTLTRFEFAAALNACLDRVNELIATATADVITRQDLASLQRLQEEFSAELATLRGRVDALEARTAELEANQFSTTTKLSGEAIFGLYQAFGEKQADRDTNPDNNPDLQSNTAFANRVRLTLNTSFTGKDRLQTRLNYGNFVRPTTGTNMTRLGFEASDDLNIDKVNYTFNLSDSVRVKIDAVGADLDDNVPNFHPDFASSGGGAISRYGRFSPIYRTGGGSALTVNLNPSGPLTLSAAYVASNANNPNEKNGIFDGGSTIFGQVAFRPSNALNVGFSYARAYQNSESGVNLFGSTGSRIANNPFGDVATSADHYGFQASLKPSSSLTLGGWAGFSNAKSEVSNADADMFYWTSSLAVKDFGREGNVLGLIFGQPPKITGGSSATGTSLEESDTSYHLEGLYKMRFSDNITVTPGVLVILNPENNDNNETIYVGTLRTTFRF
ncbi:iron uptake porin [Anabaenopsis tanganyikae CS-531]|uniref:Iron uptake porin n=2 Tax=Anabaenopsis TaxID=110103 RepID=A0ABT5ATY7_9CYAN|nr:MULTISPECIES: iron uptake porin [Anabaenopsis]MDB9540781.1 iron uptake porin [Anabaenopsis arnoldii]MDH6093219.1 iron uptake porin [Anabaenopsis arnoldii]MDH6104933.1 iron uptake porin [Anabaenopsis tanganyikae CS-531]